MVDGWLTENSKYYFFLAILFYDLRFRRMRQPQVLRKDHDLSL